MATENPVPGKKLSEKEAADRQQAETERAAFNLIVSALEEVDDEESQKRIISAGEVFLGIEA